MGALVFLGMGALVFLRMGALVFLRMGALVFLRMGALVRNKMRIAPPHTPPHIAPHPTAVLLCNTTTLWSATIRASHLFDLQSYALSLSQRITPEVTKVQRSKMKISI